MEYQVVEMQEAEATMASLRQGTPTLIRRTSHRDYYAGLYSIKEIEQYLKSGTCQYGYNVDVVSYSNGRRHTHNSNDGKAENCLGVVAQHAPVWQRFTKKRCSVRILHPQQQSEALWRVMARLEAELLCCVGCNAYLTPKGSQGFAPHYDDIDAFVLQIEGRKRWRAYSCPDAQHPITMRADYARHELPDPVLEAVLEPGDLLILPRGAVHEAESLPDAPSLHLTLSANQGSTWAALAQEALPAALIKAAAACRDLRLSVEPPQMDSLGRQAVLLDGKGAQYALTPSTRWALVQRNAARLVPGDDPSSVRVVFGTKNDRTTHARGEPAAEDAGVQGSCLEFAAVYEPALALILTGNDFSAQQLAEKLLAPDPTTFAAKLQRTVIGALRSQGLLRRVGAEGELRVEGADEPAQPRGAEVPPGAVASHRLPPQTLRLLRKAKKKNRKKNAALKRAV
ncbi:hypothetical protein QBZ16_001176 [Prototheca wickerhamii]|uniref:Bifunctional lysine-specific demethylase and histidyl-hydroxylase n=1 Tax=Prototheca wickerhamii TaxID=3111 RepID=A0AAD9MG77_PROWI|nr:hypothetical protein QBZ16_001176 [Prototheca wickerhamii]